ncbi:MAG: REP-associated tyrosine transposase [bacterium]
MKKIKIPEKGYKNLRKGRVSLPDYYYFITIACKDKKPVLSNKIIFEMILNSVFWLENSGNIILYFIIAMPDHIHWIFQLLEKKSLSEVIKSFKQYTARNIKNKFASIKDVWQAGFYDHAIRKEESLVEIIKYSWYNPVRAGIVEEPEDYPYWWSRYDLLNRAGSRLETAPTSNKNNVGGVSNADNRSRLEAGPTEMKF